MWAMVTLRALGAMLSPGALGAQWDVRVKRYLGVLGALGAPKPLKPP